MARQWQIPGGAYVNEAAARQWQIPGGPFLDDTTAAAAGGGASVTSTQELPVFGSSESVVAPEAATSTQALAPFGQTFTAVAVAAALSATALQSLAPFGQAFTASEIAKLNEAQALAPFGQSATAARLAALAATQALPSFGQSAPLGAVAALAATQALPSFGQAFTAADVAKLNEAQALAPFGQTFTAVAVPVGPARSAAALQSLAPFGQLATARFILPTPVRSFTASAPPTISDRLNSEAASGQLDPTRATAVTNIPAPKADLGSLLAAVKAIKQIIDTREGRSASVLDKSVTLRDLFNEGVVGLSAGGVSLSAGTPGGGVIPGSGTGGSTDIILTTPPAPTNLQATGAFKTIVLTWDLMAYTNFGYVEIWRGATDAVGAASLIGTSTATLFVDASGVLGTSYFYWVRAVNSANPDGSAGAVGPFNAVAGTPAGLLHVGNADLADLAVEARNIADKAVDSTKMTVTDFSTIADNPIFEAGDVGWGKESNWSIVNDPANAFNGSWCAKHTAGIPAALRNNIKLPVVQGDEFYAEAQVKLPGFTSGTGVYVRLMGYDAAGAEIALPQGNAVTSATYATTSVSATMPAGVKSIDVEIVAIHDDGIAYADNVRFQRKATYNHLAAGSIAVGSLAVATGAIDNAMIGLLAVDDARVANLSAAKLTVGDGTVGGTLKSANYIAGSTGWQLLPGGGFEANNGTFRGALSAAYGSFRGSVAGGAYANTWAWPATGGGFYLGSEGLLLGNYNTGGYLEVDAATGNISAPQFTIVGGAATFSGALSAASGTFGTVTAGLLRNSTNSAALNLSATGASAFLRSGPFSNYGYYGNHYTVELNADGSGFMARGLVSPPTPVIYNSNYSVAQDGAVPDSGIQYWTPNNTNHPVYMGEFSIDTTLNDPAGWTAGAQAAELYSARVYANATELAGGNNASVPLNEAAFRIIIQATPSWSVLQYKTGSTSFPQGAQGPSGRIYLICRVWCINAYYGPDYVNQPFQYAIRLNSVQWEVYRA